VLTELRDYLKDIKADLKLDASSEKEILRELHAHFEDRVEELKEAGLSDEEAAKIAGQNFGSAKAVAGELNQVHSSSTWAQAIVAALPHLLFALLFALHQWHNVTWLSAILVSIIVAVIYGWQHHKPAWFFSWLGYALLTLVVGGFILLILLGQALPFLSTSSLVTSWWVWLAALVYFPLLLWLLITVAVQIVRRDWLLGSLAALPLPAIAGWFLAAHQEEKLLEGNKQPLSNLEPWIAVSFFTLASIVIIFTRLRQRPLKAGILLTAGFAILILIAYSTWGNISSFSLVALALLTLVLLLGPAFLGHKVRNREIESWDYLLRQQTFHKQA